MELKEGILFHNHYLLIRVLGRGGFSEVWLAENVKVNHMEVALKVYAPGNGLDDDGLRIFREEFELMAGLNHGNLLRPFHFNEFERTPYLVLPYCERGSATNLIGAISEDEAWHFLRDVASGLAYLHEPETPIIHQDIKPHNVLMDDRGNFLITDFGISTQARGTLRKSMGDVQFAGVFAYMAPERFGRNPMPIKASDIWSLGATMFELLEGDAPYGDRGGSMQNGGAEIPELKRNWSPALKKIVKLCLMNETWDRPTAMQLVEWCEKRIKGENILPELIKFEKKRDRPKPWKKIIWGIAACLAAILIALIFLNKGGKTIIEDPGYPPDTTLDSIIRRTLDSLRNEPQRSNNHGFAPDTTPVLKEQPSTPVRPVMSTTISLTIANNTEQTATHVYMRQSRMDNWGSNRLPSGQTLGHGQTYSLSLDKDKGNKYDIRMQTSDGKTYTKTNVSIAEDVRVSFTVQDQDDGGETAVTIANNTGQSVNFVYIRQRGIVRWGSDRLESGKTLTNGASFSVQLNRSNRYDIRLYAYLDGYFYTKQDVSVASNSKVTFTKEDKELVGDKITLVNNTGYGIQWGFIQPIDEDYPVPNRLPVNLNDGQETSLLLPYRISEVSKYTIWVRDLHREKYTKNNVTVSANSRIVFSSSDSDYKNLGPPITIVNNTGKTIKTLYISPTDDKDNWGDNRMYGEQLSNGREATRRLPHPINVVNDYDIKLKDTDDKTYTKKSVRVNSNDKIKFTVEDID